MKWKNRFTNYNFWISLISAVLLIVRAFDFKFDIGNINEIATAVLGLLVVIGIISDPTKSGFMAQEQTKAVEKLETTQQSAESKEEQLPNESKDENFVDSFQNDFKVLIEKISQDINTKLSKLESVKPIESSSVEEEHTATFPKTVEENKCEEILNNLEEVAEETNEMDETSVNIVAEQTLEENKEGEKAVEHFVAENINEGEVKLNAFVDVEGKEQPKETMGEETIIEIATNQEIVPNQDVMGQETNLNKEPETNQNGEMAKPNYFNIVN